MRYEISHLFCKGRILQISSNIFKIVFKKTDIMSLKKILKCPFLQSDSFLKMFQSEKSSNMVSRVALNFGNNSELQLFHISTVISELSCNSVLLSGANFTPFMCSNWRSFHSQLSLLAQCCCFQKGFSSVFLGRLLLSSCLLLVSLSQQRWFGQVFY